MKDLEVFVRVPGVSMWVDVGPVVCEVRMTQSEERAKSGGVRFEASLVGNKSEHHTVSERERREGSYKFVQKQGDAGVLGGAEEWNVLEFFR